MSNLLIQTIIPNVPLFPGPDLASMCSVLYLPPARYHSDKIVFRPSRAKAGRCSIWSIQSMFH